LLKRRQFSSESSIGARLFLIGLLLCVLTYAMSDRLLPVSAQVSASPGIAGRLIDSQGEPIRHAEVDIYVNGTDEPAAVVESQADGTFLFGLPDVKDTAGLLPGAKLISLPDLMLYGSLIVK